MKNHNIYKGTEKSNRISNRNPRGKDCGACHGTGQVLSGRKRGSTCGTCNGRGRR